MKRGSRGIGLIELMIAMTLGLLVVLAVTQIFLSAKNTYQSQSAAAAMQEDARFVLSKMMQEIRMVGMIGCLATVEDKSDNSTYSAVFDNPITYTNDNGVAVLTLVGADVGTTGGTPTWTILSDCRTSATAYTGAKAPLAGQIAFPIRSNVYTFRNNQLLTGPANNRLVLVNNVRAFDVTFGMATGSSDEKVEKYIAKPVDTALIRSVRLTLTLSDPNNRVRNQTFNVVVSLRNRLL